MEIVVLGSGAAFSADRNPAGYAVRLGGHLVLFDLGFGNVRQMTRVGLDPADVTDVFVTHRHPDHVGDLAALLFRYRYELKPKEGRVRLWGPKGFSAFVRKLQAAHDPWCDVRGYLLEVREFADRQTLYHEDWSIDTLCVPHPTPALAYRLSYKGKTFVYSGDTGFYPALADFAAGADLFLLECASTEKEGYEGHLTPKLALATLEASGCRRGVLTHVSDAARAELARLRKPRSVSIAFDLQRLKI